jgi:hypothetical protein
MLQPRNYWCGGGGVDDARASQAIDATKAGR